MAYAKLSELNSSKDDWVVQVRLCRMWEAVNLKNDNEILGLEMIFVDDKGEGIQGFIRKNQIKNYETILEEGKVYAIRNFKVAKSAMQYKVVPSDYRIYFNYTTVVRKLANLCSEIPSNVFFFTPNDTHEERVNNNTLLTDIIGCVVGVGEIEHLDNIRRTSKREIPLASKSHGKKVMKVTLWGKNSENLDCNQGGETPLIAIITSTTIKKFRGELVYASTTGSRIYFNPDIPEAKEMSLSFAEETHGIEVLPSQQILPVAEQMFVNRKVIKEITDMTWISDDQECLFTVLAKIVSIDPAFGWCYVSCNQCNKKLVTNNGSFVCNTCNKECCYPLIRYKIHVRVNDPTRSTTFVIFNQDAEKLFDSSANKFVNRLGIGSNKVPEEITKLIGRSFVFKIKLTDYNFKDGFENYTVVKVFEVDETLEANFSESSSKKGVETKGKRNAGTMITLEDEDLPKNIFAYAEIGDSATLVDAGTSETVTIQKKKLKSGE